MKGLKEERGDREMNKEEGGDGGKSKRMYQREHPGVRADRSAGMLFRNEEEREVRDYGL